jgi:hypothetical protein
MDFPRHEGPRQRFVPEEEEEALNPKPKSLNPKTLNPKTEKYLIIIISY